MIQLSRHGVTVPRQESLRDLRQRFHKQGYLKFKDFVEPTLFPLIKKELKDSQFHEDSYVGIGKSVELRTSDRNRLNGLMHILLNDDELISAIKYITGVRSITQFRGRVYKMKSGHQHGWHDDNYYGRKLALSLNLAGSFEGGEVMLREKKTGKRLHKLSNRSIGEALLFKISPKWEHRTVPVKGRRPKTAFVGWYVQS